MRQKDDELYGAKTQEKFFATPKTILAERFRSVEFLQKDHPKNRWWVDMYADFKVRLRVQQLELGGKLEETAEGIRRPQFTAIVDALMRGLGNTKGVATGDDMEIRAGKNVLRQAMARAGESALITVNNGLCWRDGKMNIDWGEVKRAKSYLLDFYPDVDFVLCPYHGIVSVIIAKPGIQHGKSPVDGEPQWLFPMLAQYSDGGAAGKLTGIIHKICKALGYAEDLNDKLTSHGVRAGSADDVLLSIHSLNKMGVLLGAVFRGGWEYMKDCLLLRYLFEKLYISMAGKILAGYDHPEQEVAVPSLRCIIDSPSGAGLQKKLRLLAALMFSGSDWESPSLSPLRDCLIACAFMHHGAVVSKYGHGHIVAKNFVTFCHQAGISGEMIADWGEKIAAKVAQKNKENRRAVMCAKGDEAAKNALLEEQNELLRQQNAALRQQMEKQDVAHGEIVQGMQNGFANIQHMLARVFATRGIAADSIPAIDKPPEVSVDAVSMDVEEPEMSCPDSTSPAPSLVSPSTANAGPADNSNGAKGNTPSQQGHGKESGGVAAFLPKPRVINNTNEFMMKSAKGKTSPPTEYNNATVLEMKPAYLLELVRSHGLNLDSTHPFGKGVDNKTKNRAKTVFMAVLEAAASPGSGVEKFGKILAEKTPIDTLDAATKVELIKEIKRMASAVMSNFVRQLTHDYWESRVLDGILEAAEEGKKQAERKKRMRRLKGRMLKDTVGTFYSIISDRRTTWQQPPKKKSS